MSFRRREIVVREHNDALNSPVDIYSVIIKIYVRKSQTAYFADSQPATKCEKIAGRTEGYIRYQECHNLSCLFWRERLWTGVVLRLVRGWILYLDKV